MRATACRLLAYVGPLWSGRWVRFVCELRPGAVLCTLLCARHAKGTLSMRCSLCRSLRDAPAAVFLAAVGGPGVRGLICAAADAGLHCSWPGWRRCVVHEP
jgi:hypothetical protein